MPATRRSYTASFKQKVIARFKATKNARATAQEFDLSDRQVRDWVKASDKLQDMPRDARQAKGSGRKVRDPEMDSTLAEWVDLQRKEGHAVSGTLLRFQAQKEAKARGLTDFKASEGWLGKFKRRQGLSTRRRTSLAQRLPKDHEEKVISFHRFVIKMRKRHNYPLSHIYNMDETPLKFDNPSTQTLNKIGEKTIPIRTNGADKRGFTVVLTCAADGSKQTPHVIFKGKRKLGEACQLPGVVTKVQVNGWMDEAGCLEWIRAIFPLRCSERKLLVWDSFRGHLTEEVKKELSRRKVDTAVIPGGLTSMLQPLDVALNKPFKDTIRASWAQWMVEDDHSFTPAGNQRPPTKEVLIRWVKDAWASIESTSVRKAFLKTGISCALDGTQDDAVWEEAAAESDTGSDIDSDSDSDSDFGMDPLHSDSDGEEFLGFTPEDLK